MKRIIDIAAAEGGADSQDLAQILAKAYQKLALKKSWSFT